MPRADTGRSNQIYGELRDSLHITGYAFERACERLEALLAGEQWKQVAPGFANINAFLASLDLDKFQATLEQKKRIAKRIKELQPAASNRQIARTVKVNHDTVDRVVGGHPPNAPEPP